MKLETFLVRAKVACYADGGGEARVLDDGSKELTFQEGEFQYRDRYLGFDPFVGEEVVWHAGRVVWAMNYYGAAVEGSVPAGQVYQFLQKAMGRVQEERPFRGPRSLVEGDWQYLDESEGDSGRFRGVERILYQGREVYRLDYHGGSVGAGE